MTIDTGQARFPAAATYNAAADHFDAEPLDFWVRHSRRAVELAALRRGERVLDAGCGTGAAALPAAAAVGPDGTVLGIDIAELMLERARAKAVARALGNVSFRCADMTASGEPDRCYDAVLCVFALFFTPDMGRLAAELWRMVRPGGRLVMTVWGPRALEPAASVFGDELRRVQPDVAPLTRPWERLTDPDSMRRFVTDAIGVRPDIVTVTDSQPLTEPTDWWTIVLGSGFRGEIEKLSPSDCGLLKARMLRRIAAEGIDAVETNAVHAIARRAYDA